MANISIRRYELGDVPLLFEAAKESSADVFPWLPWCHPDFEIEESETWIAEQVRLWDAGAEFEMVIVGEVGEYLGGCGLNRIDPAEGSANLGYWIRSSATGRGIAPRAVGLVCRWAFENTDLQRLEIVCAVGNVRSQRVAEKAGAIREGIRKDCLDLHGETHDAVVFSITRTEGRISGARGGSA